MGSNLATATERTDVKFALIQDKKERQTIENINWVDFLDSKARLGEYIKSRANLLKNATIPKKLSVT